MSFSLYFQTLVGQTGLWLVFTLQEFLFLLVLKRNTNVSLLTHKTTTKASNNCGVFRALLCYSEDINLTLLYKKILCHLYVYSQFEDSIQFGQYLYVLPQKVENSIMQLLRASSHQLYVETGHHGSRRRHQHLSLCHSNNIKHEHHHVLVCSIYFTIQKEVY